MLVRFVLKGFQPPLGAFYAPFLGPSQQRPALEDCSDLIHSPTIHITLQVFGIDLQAYTEGLDYGNSKSGGYLATPLKMHLNMSDKNGIRVMQMLKYAKEGGI